MATIHHYRPDLVEDPKGGTNIFVLQYRNIYKGKPIPIVNPKVKRRKVLTEDNEVLTNT
jgi:hypothetical protein